MATKKKSKVVAKSAPKKAAKPAKKAKAAVKAAPKAAPKKAVAKPAKKVAEKVAKPVVQKFVPVPPKKPVLIVPKNTGSRQYTQAEFLDSVMGYCGFRRRSEAREFYGSFANMLAAALKSGYKVVLPGLGKLQVRRTKARKGRNPLTGQEISIPAKKKVAFTALKALKESVL